jgi:glycosyltransferase involved in cell wall biosynthesis
MSDSPDSGGRSRAVVCHITIVHSPTDGRIFHKECLSLVRAGYQVHLVAPCAADHTAEGVRVHALPRPGGRLARMLIWPWLAFRKVRSIRPRPAICHFHDPELLPAMALLRLLGHIVIFDVHENVRGQITEKHYLPRPVRALVARLYGLAERVLTWRMASMHVLESIAVHYRTPKAVARNLPELDGGVSSRVGAETAATLANERPTPDFRPPWRLIYSGGITLERGAMRMLELMVDLRRRNLPMHLQLVGPVYPQSLVDEMRRYIGEHDLEPAVTITGLVGPAESLRLIGQCHVGLCLLAPTPNYLNSLATKILEYMLYGLPVVASNFPTWREYVSDSGSGIMVDVHDVRGIADAVQALLADPERMRQMSQAGRRAVREKYCWDKEQQHLLDFYERLLSCGY